MLTLPRSVRACAAIRAAVLEIETRKHAPLQGLVIGGTTGGVVFDKRKLMSIFATISSLAATGIPMLLPLRPERALEDRASLRPEQQAALEAVAATFEFGGAVLSSCMFNVTLSIGGG